VNREQTTAAGHRGVVSGTQYHNDRQEGSSKCTTIICNSYSSRYTVILDLSKEQHSELIRQMWTRSRTWMSGTTDGRAFS
jgi:hypothetical protein